MSSTERSRLDLVVTLAVALVAAAASYGHMYDVALMAGEPVWIARAFPVTVDGLVVAALRRGETGRNWLLLGLVVSVAANVVAKFPMVATAPAAIIAVAAWPPLALYGTHRLVSRQRPAQAKPASVKPKGVPKPAVNGDAPRRLNGTDPLICEVKELAEQLGKVPARRKIQDEFHVGPERAGRLQAAVRGES